MPQAMSAKWLPPASWPRSSRSPCTASSTLSSVLQRRTSCSPSRSASSSRPAEWYPCMRIAFDGTTLQPGRTGVGYYTEHLLHHIVQESPDDDVVVIANHPI